MAYFNTTLIARRGYSGRARPGRQGGALSGFLDDILSGAKSAAGSVLDFYGKEKTTEGANAALTAQNQALTEALARHNAAAQGGVLGLSTTELMIGGGAILGAVLLLRKK